MECYSSFSNGSFEVDVDDVNVKKIKAFEDFLGGPKPFSVVHNVNLDFLSDETLEKELTSIDSFDATKPTMFIS